MGRPADTAGDGTNSPRPVSSFPALRQRPGYVPPDTNGAVGPRHLMVALNSHVAIQARTGRVLRKVPLEVFWQRKDTRGSVFDPRVLYDPDGRRWIATVATRNLSGPPDSSSVMIAVSRTRNPLGRWNFYRVDVDSPFQADQPHVGVNGRWIVVQAQLLSGGSFAGAQQVFVFEKADLYRGGPGRFAEFAVVYGSRSPLSPVVIDDPAVETMYLLQFVFTSILDPPELRIHAVTGPVGSETLALEKTLSMPAAPFPNNGNLAPQRDAPTGLEIDDATRLGVASRNGSLWAVHTIWQKAPTPRSALEWWRLDAATGAVLDRGLVDDVTGRYFYAYPSIAVNRFDDVLIGYSRFSAAEYPSAAYSLRLGTDAPGTLRAEHVMKAGEGPFVSDDHGRNRWGDYSATVVDPRNGRDLWTIQEYAERENRWGTWWARIVPRR